MNIGNELMVIIGEKKGFELCTSETDGERW